MKKENESKRGISLVALVIILILAVCAEGVYIIKLRGNNESNDIDLNNSMAKDNNISTEENSVSTNEINNGLNVDGNLVDNANNVENVNNVETTNNSNNAQNNIGEVNEENNNLNNEENASNTQNNTTDEFQTPEAAQTATHVNEDVINSLGYDVNTMIDNIVDSIEAYATEGKIIKTQSGSESQLLTNEEAKNNRDIYKDYIKTNIDNTDIISSIRFEKGKLICDYNIKNIINFLGLNSNNFAELGANESGIKSFEF